MLATNYEWQLDSFRNAADAQIGTWEAVLVSFDTTPFLLHRLHTEDGAEPFSVLIESTEKLVAELTGHAGQTNLALDILFPAAGAQPVHELWSYRGRDDQAVFYAYVNRDGELAPCHPEQPRCMMALQRQFTFQRRERPGHEGSGQGACAAAIGLSATITEAEDL